MEIVDLTELLERVPLDERAPALARLDSRLDVGLARFSRHPRWEVHPAGDELLYVLDGELELTLLLDDARPSTVLGPGMLGVVPRDVWHSPVPRQPVTLLHVADYGGTRVSDDDDPRG